MGQPNFVASFCNPFNECLALPATEQLSVTVTIPCVPSELRKGGSAHKRYAFLLLLAPVLGGSGAQNRQCRTAHVAVIRDAI